MLSTTARNHEESKEAGHNNTMKLCYDDVPMDDLEPERPNTVNMDTNVFKYRFSTSNKPIPSLIKAKISKPGVNIAKGIHDLTTRDSKPKTSMGKANYNPAKYSTKVGNLHPSTNAQPSKQKGANKIHTSKKYAQCFKPNTTRDTYKKPQLKTTMDAKVKKNSVKTSNKKYKKEVAKPALYMRNSIFIIM